jgi:hypothetical protein
MHLPQVHFPRQPEHNRLCNDIQAAKPDQRDTCGSIYQYKRVNRVKNAASRLITRHRNTIPGEAIGKRGRRKGDRRENQNEPKVVTGAGSIGVVCKSRWVKIVVFVTDGRFGEGQHAGGTDKGKKERLMPPPLPQGASPDPRHRRSRRRQPPGTASTRKPNLASWTRLRTRYLAGEGRETAAGYSRIRAHPYLLRCTNGRKPFVGTWQRIGLQYA